MLWIRFLQAKVNEVAAEAVVSKILICRYFGDLDGLIDAYIRQKDFWITYQLKQDTRKISRKKSNRWTAIKFNRCVRIRPFGSST